MRQSTSSSTSALRPQQRTFVLTVGVPLRCLSSAHGDVATLIKEVIDDNCHWISPGKDKLSWAGSFKGKQEIANFFTQLNQHWEFTEFASHDMIERGTQWWSSA